MAYLRATGKCILIMLCLFILGTVLPVLSMIGAAVINQWDDDAPGGGFILIAVWLLSEISTLICGVILCSDIWRCRDSINHGNVKGMMLRCLCFISAISFGAGAFVLLLSGPSGFRSKLLSISTAVLYASLSLFLLWIAAKQTHSKRAELP